MRRNSKTALVPKMALGLATLAALGLAARPAAAQATEYNNQSGFFTAVEGSPSTDTLTTLLFNGLSDTPPYFTSYGSSFTDGDIDFTTAPTDTIFVTSPSYGVGYNYGTRDVLGAFDGNGDNAPITALLPTDTSAVGFDLGDFDGNPFTVTLTPVMGAATTYTVAGGEPKSVGGNGFNYVGFTSDTPLASVTFSGSAAFTSGASFDNFTYATASFAPAPEPSQFAGLGLGVLGLAGLALQARRRKPQAA